MVEKDVYGLIDQRAEKGMGYELTPELKEMLISRKLKLIKNSKKLNKRCESKNSSNSAKR